MRTLNTKIYLALFAALVMTGCASKANYLRYSFDETARLKIESMTLLQGAGGNYDLHALKADSVLAGINSAYQDANLRNKNQESMRQWEIILDSAQTSLAGMLWQWKKRGTLSKNEIANSREYIAGTFDRISKLEDNKGR